MQADFTLEYTDLEATYQNLIVSIKKYFKQFGFERAVLGLSGGLDSTICAVLLADALGSENVFGISMPSEITPENSKSEAKMLAANLKINFEEVPIKNIINTFNIDLSKLFQGVDNFWSRNDSCNSYTQDNLQARARAMILYAVSNEYEKTLPIATSDKSEIYMGYSTINGDSSGGLAPIADICKTKLFALGYWMNANRNVKNAIPETILTKRPSAELAIDENTGKPLCAEDALMPYAFIDEIIYYIENKNADYVTLLNTTLVYEETHTISVAQKKEWLDKFYNRMNTYSFKLTYLPPCIVLAPHSLLQKCNKAV